MGMSDPDVPADACQPMEAADNPALECPTFGLDKFDRMVDLGLLEVAYEIGGTRIYRVADEA
jgi:hypothetical protein